MINLISQYTYLLNRQVLQIVLVLSGVLLLLAYIVTVNNVATAGFRVSELQREVVKLKKEQAELQLQASALGSLQRVESESRNLSLAPVENVEYLEVGSTVAIR